MKNGALCGGGASLLAALVGVGSLAAQTSSLDGRLRALVASMHKVVGGDVEAAAVKEALTAAQDYVDALGKSSERAAMQLLVDDLQRHQSGPFVLADESVTRLLDEVKYQRTRGRPERMIPPLLALQTRFPDDPRVLYTLGEAFGVASSVFDAERAQQSFRRLLDMLRERTEVATEPVGRGQSLSQFLPELADAGQLLSEAPTDTTARLRQQLLAWCEELGNVRPIGLWRLADPQMDRLYEQLSLARALLDQTRCREVLEAMLQMQPVNAVLQFALAEVHLSLGSEFDCKKAEQCLEEFLELTDPATLGGPEDRRRSVLTSDDIVRDLARFRLAKPRSDLEKQRVDAHEYLDAIGKTIRKAEDGLLLAPDRDAVEREVLSLSKKVETKQSRWLGPALNNIAKYERKVNDSRIPANIRGQHRQKIRQWQRKADGYQAEIDAMEKRQRELEAVLQR